MALVTVEEDKAEQVVLASPIALTPHLFQPLRVEHEPRPTRITAYHAPA